MTTVADLGRDVLARTLAGPGLRLRTGPVVNRIRTRLPAVIEGIRLLYAQHPLGDPEGFADFHVEVALPRGARRLLRPQVLFRLEGGAPFNPLPSAHAFPMLEWGLNWCVSSHCHQYLVIHAAVLARDGRAVVMPAPPGSGKSTLTAALAMSGWRLMSDELALVEPATGWVVALPRPVSLKNASIDVVRAFAPGAAMSPVVRDTIKGAVAHLAPPADAVRRADERATPAWIVFPQWAADAQPEMIEIPKAEAFMRLADNAFNYDLHGRRGFETLAALVEASSCAAFRYARLPDALRAFEALAAT